MGKKKQSEVRGSRRKVRRRLVLVVPAAFIAEFGFSPPV
ncbi:uncharacterized protein G2W53_037806 [Senna tora]|uniref:Uncharacterized protein n=1 Tax=Senna tora TaxID=362788 RepID=A0A834SJV4_9FABA|nr:uncharacterized protein G2W53_037806 [Senna tora]